MKTGMKPIRETIPLEEARQLIADACKEIERTERRYRDRDAASLTAVLRRFLAAPIEQDAQRRANLAYASAQPMELIANQYVDVAEALASESGAAALITDPLAGTPDRAPVRGL